MIPISRLLCGYHGPADHLRYQPEALSESERKPIVVWNTTRACNLRCVHCYVMARKRSDRAELTTVEGKKLIDDVVEFGCPVLLFSGGEPLLRKDIFELAEYAKARGLRIVLSSNGTLITPEMAQKIKDVGFDYVGISVDGMREVNDRFRRRKGAFDDALAGIRNLRNVGVRVGLRFTMTRRNINDLPEIFKLAEEEKIPRLCLYHLVYSGRGSTLADEDLEHGLMRDTMDMIFASTKALHARGVGVEVLTVDNHADGPYLYLKLLSTDPERAAEAMKLLRINGGNGSGTRIACIGEKGDVHADQFWRHYSFGNIRARRFGEIWTDTSDKLMWGLKHKHRMIKGRCALCAFFDICGGGFRVRAEAVHGDVWASDPACYLTDEEIEHR